MTRRSLTARWQTIHRYRALAWFALALFALDAVVAANAKCWTRYDLNPYRERIARCRERQWDVVIVGGSPAMCGVNPAVLVGATWRGVELRSGYNLGLPLATASEVCLAAEHAILSPPKLLIYAASATDLNDARLEPQGPRTIMSPTDVARWTALRPRDSEWCVRHYFGECVSDLWQLYRFRNGIRLWAADRAERTWPGLCPDVASDARLKAQIIDDLRTGCGYRPSPAETPATRLDLWKAEGRPCDRLPFMEPYRIGGGHLRYLDRMLSWATARGIEILLLDLPVPLDLESRLYPREYALFRTTLAHVAAKHGVPLVAAHRDSLGLSDADFSDLIHLNAAGAARLSAWLRATLDNRGPFAAAEGAPR